MNDFEKQFPLSRHTGASKIGNGVISLLWQLRCHCNPDHNKLSSLSFAAVVETFSKLLLQVVYAQIWEVSTLKNPIEPPLRPRLARIERVMWKFKKLDIATLSTNILTPWKAFWQRKSQPWSLSYWYSQLAEHSLPCVQLYYFKSRHINVMCNEQAAVFYQVWNHEPK